MQNRDPAGIAQTVALTFMGARAEKWPNPQLPTKELIDPVTGDTPVFVSRYDGHQSLANSAALKLAGVSAMAAGASLF